MTGGWEPDDLGGGRITSGPASGWTLRRRVRHDEVWFESTPALDASPGATTAKGAALGRLVAAALDEGATAVHWETDDDAALVEPVAAAAGLDLRRDILRLERSLPLPESARDGWPPITTRPLRPGSADEAAWVRCNNRAFASHPDQGHESVASLHAAMTEPWFDHAGFLLLDAPPDLAGRPDPVDEPDVEDVRLDGFCWTKEHPATGTDRASGEIYVIGVDPAAAGRGLGGALVVAGLDHLTGRGLRRSLLYVESDNDPARRLYERLGFDVVATRRVRSRAATPG